MGEVTREQALKDFRYRDGHEEVVEAYQITEHAIFADSSWPPWLQMQKTKGQMNCVYRQTDDPSSLFINMNGTDGQLGFNAWIIRGADDSLAVMGEFEFNAAYSKVVPVPDKPEMEPTDGLTDQEFYDRLTPEMREKHNVIDPSTRPQVEKAPVAEVVSIVESPLPILEPNATAGTEILELRTAIADAIAHLKPATSKAAVKATLRLEVGLETAHEGGLKWCDCGPGSCDEVSKWGCRMKSPLL